MKRFARKLAAALLSAVLVFSLIPFAVSADDSVTFVDITAGTPVVLDWDEELSQIPVALTVEKDGGYFLAADNGEVLLNNTPDELIFHKIKDNLYWLNLQQGTYHFCIVQQVQVASTEISVTAIPAVAESALTVGRVEQVAATSSEKVTLTFTPETTGLYELNIYNNNSISLQIELFQGDDYHGHDSFVGEAHNTYVLEGGVACRLVIEAYGFCDVLAEVCALPRIEATLDQPFELNWDDEYSTQYVSFIAPETGIYQLTTQGGFLQGMVVSGGTDIDRLHNQMFIYIEKDAVFMVELQQLVREKHSTGVFTLAPKATAVKLENGAEKMETFIDSFFIPEVTFLPKGALEDVYFESSNEEVVAIYDGTPYAQAAGTATLTVTTQSGLTDSITVAVLPPKAWDINKDLVETLSSTDKPFLITPEEDGVYIFQSFSSGDPHISLYDENGNYIADADDWNGLNFRLAAELEGGKNYTVRLGLYGSSTSVTVTCKKQGAEVADTGIAFEQEEYTIPLFSAFAPNVLAYPSGQPLWGWCDFTYSDPSFFCDSENGMVACRVGTVTVTATTEDGLEATATVTVTAPADIALDTPVSVAVKDDVGQAFTFTAPEDGRYVFRTFDCENNPCLWFYDSEHNFDFLQDDSPSSLNAYITVYMGKGEVLNIYADAWSDNDTYQLVVSTPAKATTLTATMYNNYYAKNGDTYYFDLNAVGVLSVLVKFGAAYGAEIEDVELSCNANGVFGQSVEYEGDFIPYGVGQGTLTVTSQSGLTHTITIVITDGILLGDVNGDGKVDSTDARLTLQYFVGSIDADDLNLAAADVDGNGKVDSTDARLILQHFVGSIDKFPVE